MAKYGEFVFKNGLAKQGSHFSFWISASLQQFRRYLESLWRLTDSQTAL